MSTENTIESGDLKGAPAYLKDLSSLMLEDGNIATSNVWYHGTTSSLVKSIKNKGLHGGGDAAWIKRTQGTLQTVGNRTFESKDPVFLTQSKELAYFWAQQRVHSRNIYFKKDETPVVLKVTLNEDDNAKINPDAGGAALIMEPGNEYIIYVKDLFIANGQDLDDFDQTKADRMIYLTRLGLAYTNDYIPGKFIEVVAEDS
ncbi:MAG: hypothetical protein ACJAW8_001728 [Oleispira sp.]|jgi:hypothetical protein|tara:strand:- start:1895 stop:2497 length:603 start_codon:yes stop_codon:yes gene_type:complete